MIFCCCSKCFAVGYLRNAREETFLQSDYMITYGTKFAVGDQKGSAGSDPSADRPSEARRTGWQGSLEALKSLYVWGNGASVRDVQRAGTVSIGGIATGNVFREESCAITYRLSVTMEGRQ